MSSVIFSLHPEAFPPTEQRTIVVVPSRDNWNDFGFYIHITIHIFDGRPYQEQLSLPGYFGFTGTAASGPDVRLLIELLEASPKGHLGATDLPNFFTMLPDMAAYREIVSKLGSDDAINALVALNDVVAAEEGIGGKNYIGVAKETLVFKEAFLRTSESYFAWTNAGSVLRGLQYESFGRISDRFKLRFQLDGRPNAHELDFIFDVKGKPLPRRFAVVIGKNGVGKSQSLGQIVRAALGGSQAMTDGNGDRPRLNRVIAFAPNSTNASAFPREKKRNSRVWYRRFTLNPTTRPSNTNPSTTDLIARLARSEERIGSSNRFEIFLTSLAVIDGWEEIGLAKADAHGSFTKLQQIQRGGEQARLRLVNSLNLRREPARIVGGRSFPLSSGEHSFLRFAALASLYIENGSLVLFDEPETHLHPQFINKLVAVLDSLLEQTGSAAIIATHSVYFVREAFEDQVIVIRSSENRYIQCERPTLRTFGADVGAISYFVFGEDNPSLLAEKMENEILEQFDSWDEIFNNFKNKLSLELLGEIRSRITNIDRKGRE